MAKVFKIKGSRNYYYRVRVDGKDKWKSTGETDRKAAQKIADGHRAATTGTMNADELFLMLVAKLDAMPAEDGKARRLDYGQRLMRLQSDRLTFGDAWARWLTMPNKSRLGDPKANTIAGYSAIWKRCATWAEGQGLTYLHELTERHAETYMGTLKQSGLTERTYGAHLKFLRSFFRVLKNQAGIVENPFFGTLTVPELQTQSKEAFTPEELKQIAEAASGDWRYLVGIGIYTGLRLTDAVHLKWENITDRITVRPEKLARRKRGGRGQVEIPIHPALAGLLAELKRNRLGKATGYLFPEMVKQYEVDRSKVSGQFGDLLEACGIATTATATEGRKRKASLRGFHSLRHSFVSLCAAAGVPQATTQRMVGHSSAEITQVYSHELEAGQAAAEINRLPVVFG